MKRSVALALAFAFVVALVPGIAHAQDPFFTSRVLRSSLTEVYGDPVISGDWVAYIDSGVLTPQNIRAYNMRTGEDFALHTENKAQFAPSISGNRVVWEDRRNDDFNVYLYDLGTRKETTVTGGPSAPGAFPDIDGNRVVYNNNAQVRIYDITTRSDTYVGDGSNARISGNWIAWQTDGTTSQIAVYDISKHVRRTITSAAPGHPQIKPDISGSIVVWEGWDGAENHIYYLDLSTGSTTPKQVVSGGSNDHDATIANSRIYFKSNAFGGTQLCFTDLGGQAMTPISLSGVMTGEDQNERAYAVGDVVVSRIGNDIYYGRIWAPTVTISGVPKTVPYKSKVTFTGSVSDLGVRIGNVSAAASQLEPMISSNAWSWTRVKWMATDSNGAYTFTTAPIAKKTYVRVWYLGAWDPFHFGSHLNGMSVTRIVIPRVALGVPTVPATITHLKKFSAHGTIQPAQTVGSTPVRVECWKRVAGSYYLKKTVSAKASYYSVSTSIYSASLTVPSAGRWRFRAVYPASTTNAYTATTWVYRTVY